jgi:serine phosphatase RsbU (regulator of sigma subunit)
MLPERGPLVGRTLAEAFPEAAAAFAATVLPLFDSGEELVVREYAMAFDDDAGALEGRRYYDVTFTPVRLEAGVVVGVLVAYLDVTHQLRRRRELERELDEERHLSDTLQRSLLPAALPQVPHLDVAARYRPAGERYDVGGDFYDVFPGRDGAWLAVVGDVCGKGPRAAARTSMVRYCLRAEAAHADDPATLLDLLNADVRRELEQDGEEDFVTVVLAVLRPAAARTDVLVATAGHPPAIIASPGAPFRTLGAAGLPVGVSGAPGYSEHAGVLGPGERLVLHTDGLLDAHARPSRSRPPSWPRRPRAGRRAGRGRRGARARRREPDGRP